MIDGFRLNDGSDDPGWSVSLQQGIFEDTGDTFGSDGTADDAAVTAGTRWSVDDSAAPGQTGRWSAQAFDEEGAVNGVTSNVPTTVVGKFEAGFGDTHRMVGAFGANKQ